MTEGPTWMAQDSLQSSDDHPKANSWQLGLIDGDRIGISDGQVLAIMKPHANRNPLFLVAMALAGVLLTLKSQPFSLRSPRRERRWFPGSDSSSTPVGSPCALWSRSMPKRHRCSEPVKVSRRGLEGVSKGSKSKGSKLKGSVEGVSRRGQSRLTSIVGWNPSFYEDFIDRVSLGNRPQAACHGPASSAFQGPHRAPSPPLTHASLPVSKHAGSFRRPRRAGWGRRFPCDTSCNRTG